MCTSNPDRAAQARLPLAFGSAGGAWSTRKSPHIVGNIQTLPPALSSHKIAAAASRTARRIRAALRPTPCSRPNRPRRCSNKTSYSSRLQLRFSPRWTECRDLAQFAFGISGKATAPSMPDQPVAEQTPKVSRHDLLQIRFDLLRLGFSSQTEALREARHVSI